MNVDRDIVDRQFQAESFNVLLQDLVAEIEALNYSITRISHIDNIHDRRAAGIDVNIAFKHYKIVEFCNLNNCSELISADLYAGVFMPVRFVVYQGLDEPGMHIVFLKPTSFAAIFKSDVLTQVALQIERDMTYVLAELDY